MPLPTSVFSGVPAATLQAWLTAAQTAYFRLATGQSASEVVTAGDVVKYRAANLDDLQAVVAQLQAAIAGRPQGGAIGVVFAL